MIGIVMGSQSDLPTMRFAAQTLETLGIPFEIRILSAHRRPDAVVQYGKEARSKGFRGIIAGAGGAAHLPGVLAACTTLPVMGVPMLGSSLGGADALYSIVQMPKGIPVATFAVGKAGAINAALYAAAIMATADSDLEQRLEAYRETLRAQVTDDDEKLTSAMAARKDGSIAGAIESAGFKS